MWSRRPSEHIPMASETPSRHHHARASPVVRPSMHSDYMARKDSPASSEPLAFEVKTPTRPGRLRSLSNDSDSGKPRSSVPLLYASTISSMSTLSSSFYQYDTTGEDTRSIELDAMLGTPSSVASGETGYKKGYQKEDPPLRLPPFQDRAIRSDAARMTRALVAEQLRALDVLHNRSVLLVGGGSSLHPIGTEVATAKGVRVFEKTGLGGGGVSGRSKKHAVKRYTAHWQVRATVDEVLALLVRDDNDPDKSACCQAAMHPETVNSKLLWRAREPSSHKTRSKSQRTVSTSLEDDAIDAIDTLEDDDDVHSILTVELDDAKDDVRFFSQRGGQGKPLFPPGPRSVASSTATATTTASRRGTQRRRRPRRSSAEWMGINWWVQHMPGKLSRDRDFIVLEKQSEFETGGSGGGVTRRGVVHLCHSVDLADVASVEKRLVSPFVRGLVIQSGIVVVESDEPGVLDVANTLEMDCAGHLTTSQQRQVIVKRLLQIETLSDLLCKTRLLQSQLLQRPPPVESKAKDRSTRCDRCQFKVSRFSRRSLEPCRACERVVCTQCSSVCEFPPALVRAAASPQCPLPADVGHDSVWKVRVCAHCVVEHSRPRLLNQSVIDMLPLDDDDDIYDLDDMDDDDGAYEHEDDDDDEDEDDAAERTDFVENALPACLPSQQLQSQRKQRRRASRASEWNPSRSSRIAENLVDDFLVSIRSNAAAFASGEALSPTTMAQDLDASIYREPAPAPEANEENDEDAHHESRDTVLYTEPLPSRRESRATSTASMRRQSVASAYTPLQGYDPVPRRKRSIFESIPEPAPRKNVVLFEGL
jgi:hypothetical protein